MISGLGGKILRERQRTLVSNAVGCWLRTNEPKKDQDYINLLICANHNIEMSAVKLVRCKACPL